MEFLVFLYFLWYNNFTILKWRNFMKKILIFYGTYGGGHLSAAKAIKEYYTDNYKNIEIEMYDCIEYISKFINKITTGAYNSMAKRAPWAWKKVYYGSEKGIIAKFSNSANHIMANKLCKLIKNENPDLIISTHPFSSQMCGLLKEQKKINMKIATVMTDFHIHSQWLTHDEAIDYFFVSNENMKTEMIAKGIDGFKIFVTGIPISKKFSSSFNSKKIYDSIGLSKNAFTVLYSHLWKKSKIKRTL